MSQTSGVLHVSMDLLYDTQKLRILLEKDQKINLGKGKVDTFKRDGYQSVSLYTKRLIEMCSYEFQIEAAKALFGKLSDDYKECRLQRLKNKTFSDFADGELNEDDGELNRGSNDIDGSSAEKWVLYGEPEMYSYNDIVVAIATKSFGDETVSVRYIGCLGRISRVPQTSLRKYIFTFNAQISPSKEIDVLMWTVGNLTSYKRVVDSLSNQDAMKSIPKLFLRAPATDINPLTDGTTDIQDGVPERMNLAQKVAISRAIQKDGDDVVLVQGPPGCGKSTMIVEMVRLLTSHGRGNAGMQVLVCAQTNVAVADLAYKYVTHNEFKGKFDCVMDMRPPKIADRHKRDTLEPFTVTARYHQVVNAVLHVIIRDFEHIPTTCHGSTTRERVMNIVASDFNACVESGLLMLLSGRATLLMSIKTADLTRMKRLILGMRNELEPFFKPDDLSLLLEQCSAGQYTDTSRPESFPIYGWVRQALLSAATVIFCTINVGISVTSKKFLGNLAYIVVDEAAQALEPDVTALMCIDSCFRRLILVGDPQQLPGYCASNRGKQQMMDRSLMERLEEYQLCHFTLLDVQYRMHQRQADFSRDNPQQKSHYNTITGYARYVPRISDESVDNHDNECGEYRGG
ncbi:hypothetical protein BX616_003050 [Lobosporangium transversale]|nr:hypothetical protein BX616_003050 [Lobosporangium transversale]